MTISPYQSTDFSIPLKHVLSFLSQYDRTKAAGVCIIWKKVIQANPTSVEKVLKEKNFKGSLFGRKMISAECCRDLCQELMQENRFAEAREIAQINRLNKSSDIVYHIYNEIVYEEAIYKLMNGENPSVVIGSLIKNKPDRALKAATLIHLLIDNDLITEAETLLKYLNWDYFYYEICTKLIGQNRIPRALDLLENLPKESTPRNMILNEIFQNYLCGHYAQMARNICDKMSDSNRTLSLRKLVDYFTDQKKYEQALEIINLLPPSDRRQDLRKFADFLVDRKQYQLATHVFQLTFHL